MKRLLCLLLIIIFSFDVTAQDYDDTILPDSLALLLQDKSDKIVSLAVIVDYYFDNRMYQKAKPYIDEINRLSKAKKDSYANVLSSPDLRKISLLFVKQHNASLNRYILL